MVNSFRLSWFPALPGDIQLMTNYAVLRNNCELSTTTQIGTMGQSSQVSWIANRPDNTQWSLQFSFGLAHWLHWRCIWISHINTAFLGFPLSFFCTSFHPCVSLNRPFNPLPPAPSPAWKPHGSLAISDIFDNPNWSRLHCGFSSSSAANVTRHALGLIQKSSLFWTVAKILWLPHAPH
jgi:hypothetical protein